MLQISKKITVNNPNIYIVNINAYTKFGEILSICSPDTDFVCLFVLMLYVPSQQLWSWRDGQFI